MSNSSSTRSYRRRAHLLALIGWATAALLLAGPNAHAATGATMPPADATAPASPTTQFAPASDTRPAKSAATVRRNLEAPVRKLNRCPWCVPVALGVAGVVARVTVYMMSTCVRSRVCGYKVAKWIAGPVATGVERAMHALNQRADCWNRGNRVRCILTGNTGAR